MDIALDLEKKLNRKPTVQEIQDEIFRQMTPDQKSRLTSDFSKFILDLNKIGQSYGSSRTSGSSRKNSKRL